MGLFSFLKRKNDAFFDALSNNASKNALKVAKQQGNPKELDDVMQSIKSQNDEVDEILARIEKKADLVKKDKERRDRTVSQYKMKKSRNESENKAKAAIAKNRRQNLIDKYGKEIGPKLFRSELFLEMDLEMLSHSKGNYDKKVSNVSKGKETVKLYYGKKKNRLGNDSFNLEVTLKDGKVTGWKDLTTVGTRNK